jgi:hypothetical protein
MRRNKLDQPANGNGHSILADVPTAETLEERLAGLELESARVRTLLAAVRQMSGSRQRAENLVGLDEVA